MEKQNIPMKLMHRSFGKKLFIMPGNRAEPGILFWDQVIRESIPDCYADLGYKTTSTNPCGEIPLCNDDSWQIISY